MKLPKTKEAIIIIVVIAVAFVALFFLFHMHSEFEQPPGFIEKLKWLPWGWSVKYESGLIIVDNLFDALIIAGVYSIILGLLAYVIILLFFEKPY
jgi:hypothetical protein